MQNPNAAAYPTSSLGVRASRILLLMGVFAVVPAAGTLPANDVALSNPTTAALTQPFLTATTNATIDAQWRSDFDDVMRRLWKWWECAAGSPDDTPEQLMERFRRCYGETGVLPALPPSDHDDVRHTIDDVIHQVDKAPPDVDPDAVAGFRTVLEEIIAKLG